MQPLRSFSKTWIICQ